MPSSPRCERSSREPWRADIGELPLSSRMGGRRRIAVRASATGRASAATVNAPVGATSTARLGPTCRDRLLLSSGLPLEQPPRRAEPV